MTLGKILLIMAMSPMAIMAQTSSTSDISEVVDEQVQTEQEEKVERIEVTGSLIKRVDVEGPKPVQTLDREALDRAGYNSAADVLRDLSANTFGSAREQSGSTVAGIASVNLRGLGSDRTLVLINGRRMAKDGIANVVDLNLIPVAAIERMEILKDAGSATYGSDAIGGTVNIILKKDFDGAEISMRHENAEFQGGNRTMVAGTFGKSTSKGNIMATLQYRNNTKLFSKDRPWTREGLSFNSPIPNINDGSGYRPADDSCENGALQTEGPGAGLCGFNFSQFSTETPEIQQFNAISSGRYELNDSTELYFQAQGSRKYTEWQYAPGVVRFLNQRNNSRLRGDYVQDVVNNTGGTYDPNRGVDVWWRSLALGNRETEVTTWSYGGVAGGKKYIGDSWEIDAHVGTNRIERDDVSVNGYANLENLRRDLGNGTCQFMTPGGTCDFNDDVAYNPWNKTESRLDFAEVRGTGELFEIPGGAVAMAIGAQTMYETFGVSVDEQSALGNVSGGGASTTGSGSRRVNAAYTELAIPVLENLEFSVAARYDDYSDFGDTVNPAASIKFKPVQSVLLRANASTGFKAPNMTDLYQAVSEGNPSFVDRKGCETNSQACGVQQWLAFTGGNEELEEERSRSLSVGAVFEPNSNFNVSVDFFHVELENVVGLNFQGLADADQQGVDLSQYGTTVNRDPVTGLINNIETSYQNLGQRKVAGYDFGFGVNQPTRIGTFGFQFQTNYLIRYDEQLFPGTPFRSTLSEIGQPRWRNNMALAYSPTQNLDFIFNFVTTGSHYREVPEDGKLERYTQIDATVAYALRKLNARVMFGARNMLGDTPPLNTSDVNNQLSSALYNPIGRRFFAAYNQSF